MFRIGEFSKIAQVSASLLRYYDEIGLLNPVRIDTSSGYRYYSVQQLPRLHRILALKDLGLTLDQITRLLEEDISIEEIQGMLIMRKAQIEQSLQEEVQRLRHVEARLDQVSHSHTEFDVVLKPIPDVNYLALRTTLPNFSAGFGIMQEMSQSVPAHVGETQLGYFTAIIHSDSFENDRVDLEMGFQIENSEPTNLTLPSGRKLSTRRLKAVESMATVVRLGGFENNYQSYGAIGQWIESNGYEIIGPGREVLITAPRGEQLDEMVTEVQFPVTQFPDSSQNKSLPPPDSKE